MARRLTMISTKSHRYGNKLYKEGEFFTVPGLSDATLLEKLGRARRAQVVDEAPVRAVVDAVHEVRSAVFESVARRADEAMTASEPEKKRRGRPKKVKPAAETPQGGGVQDADSEGGE